jgi:hypothetical protein
VGLKEHGDEQRTALVLRVVCPFRLAGHKQTNNNNNNNSHNDSQ